jgi:alpha-glucosidase
MERVVPHAQRVYRFPDHHSNYPSNENSMIWTQKFESSPLEECPLKPLYRKEESGAYCVEIHVEPGSHFYGGGENSLGLALNNKTFFTWNRDAYRYHKSSENLYQSHPYIMLLCQDGTCFGIIADTYYPLSFSNTDASLTIKNTGQFIGSSEGYKATLPSSYPFSVVIFQAKSPQELVKTLSSLTGKMSLPPKWALGYHQCRWSYYPEERVVEVAQKFRELSIPCDTIWMDIHYMDEYRIFTFDKKIFPNPKELNDKLHDMGFHSVWMIDPGVKKQEGYSVYDQCMAGNHAVLKNKSSDEPFVGKVWPGDCVFPDFTQESTRTWWGGLYKDFFSHGIDGVWNDMNEPAVFDSANMTMDMDCHHRGFGGGDHYSFHNIYGMLMIKASKEGMLEANPTKRPFLLTRSNYLGGQRYAATWTGDNTSNWEHLKLTIPMILNLSLSGQPFSGSDIGGFEDDADPTLFARWMGFGTLLPFSRGHSVDYSTPHEPWAFGGLCQKTCKTAIERRYKLLPYLYTLFYLSSTEGSLIVAPSFFIDATNPLLRSEDSSFLLGSDLLVVVNTLPPDLTETQFENPALCALQDWHNVLLEESKDVTHDLPILKIREGAVIPTQQNAGQYVGEIKNSDQVLLLYVCFDHNGLARGSLYDDDGDGFGYQDGEFSIFGFEVNEHEKTINVSHKSGKIPFNWKSIDVKVVNRPDHSHQYETRFI